MLTKEKEFLLSTANEPKAKIEYLDRFQFSINITSKPNTSYNLKDILNRNNNK